MTPSTPTPSAAPGSRRTLLLLGATLLAGMAGLGYSTFHATRAPLAPVSAPVQQTTQPNPVPATAQAPEAQAPEAQANRSIYQLETPLRDQNGKTVGLDVFRGQPVLISMFYASCPMACPLLINDIKRLEQRLPPEVLQQTRVLLVSMDAERDTPQALTQLAQDRGLDLNRWRLTSTPEAQARELAAILGIKYRRLSDGNFDHTSVITLLDANGNREGRIEGAGQPSDALVKRLTEGVLKR